MPTKSVPVESRWKTGVVCFSAGNPFRPDDTHKLQAGRPVETARPSQFRGENPNPTYIIYSEYTGRD